MLQGARKQVNVGPGQAPRRESETSSAEKSENLARTPIHPTGPVVAVSVASRGAGWCDGHLSGNEEICAEARAAAAESRTVTLFGCEIVCDLSTPLGAAGALAAWNPGRTIVGKCPPEVARFFEEGRPYV